MKQTMQIAWLQNSMVGMEIGDEVIFRDPKGRYVFLNAAHPNCEGLEYDGLLIYNCASQDINLSFPKGRCIMVHNEPAYVHLGWNEFIFDKRSVSQADVLFSCAPNTFHIPAYYPYGLLNYDWKRVLSYPLDILEQKTKTLSCVASAKTISLRHAQRAIFTEYLHMNLKECDLYGRERNYIPHLLYGLKDYAYSIAIENTTEPGFFTEKVLYCFYSLTVPFYDGCSNLEEYFPPEAFVRIDITRPNEAKSIIHQVLSDPADYKRRLPALKEARRIFLEKYELFERVYQEISKLENTSRKLQTVFAPVVETAPHEEQLKVGYYYAVYGYPYIVKGQPIPPEIAQLAKKKAAAHNGQISHSFIINK